MKITNRDIRRKLSRLYPAEIPFEQKEYADAVFASMIYREIADELERKGVKVLQIRQERSSHTFVTRFNSSPHAFFYLEKHESLSAFGLSPMPSLENCRTEEINPEEVAGSWTDLGRDRNYKFTITSKQPLLPRWISSIGRMSSAPERYPHRPREEKAVRIR